MCWTEGVATVSDISNSLASSADSGALDPIAQLTFEGLPYDPAVIPNDEQAAAEAVLDLSVFRLAAGLMQHDHKELERIAKQETQALIKLLELIGSRMNLKKHELATLECARTRLIVVLSRLANDVEAGAASTAQLSALDRQAPIIWSEFQRAPTPY
jgi:hypothetical protein